MNFNFREFFKNFSYAFSSNLLSLLISTLIVLIVPKLIGVREYGYWQLYLFYASYVGFLHFGWSDGIFLRVGGKSYKELDRNQIFSQFYMLIMMQILLAILMMIISIVIIQDENKRIIVNLIALTMVITNIKSLPIFLLQATNRIKEYAHIIITDKVIYFLLVILALMFGVNSFEVLIIADLIGRTVSLLFSIYYCKDIFLRPFSNFKFSFIEALGNIRVGSKLMLAYIANLMIIGVIRFGIERVWDITTFGNVSLILSASNLMMLFINALGLIMFPVLRRTNPDKLSEIYLNIRDLIMVILLGLLILYYPLKSLLVLWLPEYSKSLIYMALVFPVFVFEGKISLLINTYMKTMRKEKLLLNINTIILILSIILTVISAGILKQLEITISAIVILLALKSTLAELILSKLLSINVLKDIVWEIFLITLFIISGWFVNSWQTPIIYGFAYAVFLLLKRKNIKKNIFIFKNKLQTISSQKQ